jgi:hypothetical protein
VVFRGHRVAKSYSPAMKYLYRVVRYELVRVRRPHLYQESVLLNRNTLQNFRHDRAIVLSKPIRVIGITLTRGFISIFLIIA